MVSPPRLALVEELARHDRLLEVGVGDRPGIARSLAERGRDVVAIDVAVGERALATARETEAATVAGSLRAVEADVLALAAATDAEAGAEADSTEGHPTEGEFDAVYACNLPAELQRPTVALAERLDAACLFTTLGFEEPTVPVGRRSLSGTTVYVARGGSAGPESPGVDRGR
ncbi:hypothetical protein DJ73_02455 [Halorubrum sp. Ea1]|uniref:UPF0146 family protein n=1 Tax=Halorubrum sp. Ea1 TaxID=1480718 RepID=UPI000B984056|nr:UPF0146 family protein [Halorubrum sp. Ea1]OYR55306.1 hypothetical protein DJ73_02455 [Halorubrum sp. Ea1]